MTRSTRAAIGGSAALIVLTFVVLAVLYAKMRVADTEYVPTMQTRSDALAPFFLDAVHVEGVFGNEGIDGQVFVYESEKLLDMSAWASLQGMAEAAGWQIEKDRQAYRVFTRGAPGGAERGVEEVRIGFVPEHRRVVVAWLDGYDASSVDPSSGMKAEAWAEKFFWPQFDLKMRTGGRFPSEMALDH